MFGFCVLQVVNDMYILFYTIQEMWTIQLLSP